MLIFLVLLQFLFVLIFVLLSVAFLTLWERKIMSTVQRRKGPAVIGFVGILQPIADGVKLLLKESLLPLRSNSLLFIIAPQISLILALTGWSLMPFSNYVFSDFNLGLLILLILSSVNVYSIILAGWSSNSKYSFLGSMRSAAQMISYEITIGLVLLVIVLVVGSFNLLEIVTFQSVFGWNFFPLFPLFFIFFLCILAETNRTPFDLPEAEAELVSGYNVEYAAVGFAFFFIAEYSNIILMCFLIIILFFGDFSLLFFFIKLFCFLFFIVFARVVLPRFRYDQLMVLGWKILLPLTLSFFFFYSFVLTLIFLN